MEKAEFVAVQKIEELDRLDAIKEDEQLTATATEN